MKGMTHRTSEDLLLFLSEKRVEGTTDIICSSGLLVALWVESVLSIPALQHLLTREQPEMEMPVLSISPTPGCQGSPHPTKDEKDNFVTYFYQWPPGIFRVCECFLLNAFTNRGHS